MTSAKAVTTTLQDLLSEDAPYPVLDSITSCLTIPQVFALQRVCRSFRWLPGHLLKSRLNIERHLRAFVSNPRQFRERMGQYGGIISRSFALNFFVPGCQRTPYLDVYLEAGPRAEHFASYLRLEELYVENESEHGNDDEPQTPTEMVLHNAERGTTVRLTLTDGYPLLSILKTACTTADVNFITRDKAYSLFPFHTIQQHKLYPLSRLKDDFGRRLMEYAHHGWTTRDILWPDWTHKKLKGMKGMDCRRVGDRFSLVVEFSGNFDTPMSTPSHVIEYSQFEVLGTFFSTGPNRGRRRNDDYLIEVKSLTSHALRHSFAIGVSTSWNHYLNQRLERWVLVELYKMGSTNRPGNFAANVPPFSYQVSLPASFTPPTTWDYADDQVATWYKEWEDSKPVNSDVTPILGSDNRGVF